MTTDTHAGVRNNSDFFLDRQMDFWKTKFFPKMKELGIKEFFHLGDFWDQRQSLSNKTIDRVVKEFFPLLDEYECNMTVIVGNHDSYNRNTNSVNSIHSILGFSPRVLAISEMQTINLYGVDCDFIPWINSSNYSIVMEKIKQSQSRFCFMHPEFAGFEMHKGAVAETGLKASDFDSYEEVFCGHFHTKSKKGNIRYLGSPMPYTWNDCNDDKFFYSLDICTGDVDSFPGGDNLFHRIVYDDNSSNESYEFIRNGFVKVIINEKEGSKEFIEMLKSLQPNELIEIDNTLSDMVFEETKECTNFELLKEFSKSASEEDKTLSEEKLQKYLLSLLQEAEMAIEK